MLHHIKYLFVETQSIASLLIWRFFRFLIIIVFLLILGCASFRKPLRIEGYSKESRVYSHDELIEKIKASREINTFQLMGRLKYRAGYIKGVRYAKILLIGESGGQLRIQGFRNVLTLFDLLVSNEKFNLYIKKDGILISDTLSALKNHPKLRFIHSLMDIETALMPLSLIKDNKIKTVKENEYEYIVEVDIEGRLFVYRIQRENLLLTMLKIVDKESDISYEMGFQDYRELNNKIVPMSISIKIPERKLKLSVEIEKLRINGKLPQNAFILDYPSNVKHYQIADIEDIKF